MSQILIPRQADELHKAIIAYLSSINLPNVAAALREELRIGETFDAATSKRYEGLLEKKWTSSMRLQKRVSKTRHLTPTSLSRRTHDPANWLPRSHARHTLESHREPITCIAFHPIFSVLASGSEDCTVKVWDWELGELEKSVKGHTKAVTDVDFGGPREATLLASCSNDLTIKLWDPSDDYKNIRTFSGHDHSVSAVRFVPSGATGALGSSNLLVSASRDKTLRIWDVSTGYCVKTLRGHADWIRDVCPSPDGRFLLSVSDNYTGRLWDISVTNPKVKLTLIPHEHVVTCCTFAPPTAYLHLAKLAGQESLLTTNTTEFMATGSRDKTICLWDGRGNCIKTLTGHDNWVRALMFHPGGEYLLSVSDDKTLRCWDLEQGGKCIKVLGDAHSGFVSCLRWAPGITREVATQGEGQKGIETIPRKTAENPHNIQSQRVIATGSVDQKVRIFAN
ncbi:dynein regulator [Colletotrichum eremochloae]|nr:dynein regulator [Colletotrichum eremochloae]